MLFLIGFIQVFDKWLIKLKDQPDRQCTQGSTNGAKQGREVQHRRKGENEFGKGVKEHEAILEKML